MERAGCGCLTMALVATFAGLWAGCQGLYTAVTNLSPTETTCAAYAADPPRATWLALTECEADFLQTVYEEDRETERISRVWIPVRPAGADRNTPAHFVVESDQPELLSRVQALWDRLDRVEEEGEVTAMLSAVAELDADDSLDVKGLVEFGWELDDAARADIASLAENLDPSFVILRDGQRPDFLGSLGWVLVGVSGLFGLVLVGIGLVNTDEE